MYKNNNKLYYLNSFFQNIIKKICLITLMLYWERGKRSENRGEGMKKYKSNKFSLFGAIIIREERNIFYGTHIYSFF